MQNKDSVSSPESVNLDVNSKENADGTVETPQIRTEQIFQKMDLDKNGVITENEFINGCLQDKFLYQMLTADYSENF